jgi:hypothetical protein
LKLRLYKLISIKVKEDNILLKANKIFIRSVKKEEGKERKKDKDKDKEKEKEKEKKKKKKKKSLAKGKYLLERGKCK